MFELKTIMLNENYIYGSDKGHIKSNLLVKKFILNSSAIKHHEKYFLVKHTLKM